jgi:hypothetical protein
MTVVVGVAAPDGIVLAADSRSTWANEEGRHRITSDTSHKVFALCGRFGVATYGLAFVGAKTIGGLMDEFVAQLEPEEEGQPRDVHRFADMLGEFFHDRLTAFARETEQNLPEGWLLGFLVGGYDSDGIGHILEVAVPGGEIGEFECNTAERGVMWRGQTDVIGRLVKGVALDELLASGTELPQETADELAELEYSLILPISMQDAVDFAAFLIRTTIDMQRFSDGTMGAPGLIPACGGPVRILAVTGSDVSWVSAPTLSVPLRPGQAEEL